MGLKDVVCVLGMVLKATPVGDYDKRLVILTRERGKVVAFAKGVRRPGSMLMACSRPFSFGSFYLYEGREAYTLKSAEIQNYFEELWSDMEGTCYGSYFMEFADYYTRENLDESQMLKLLYQSLRALLKPAIPNLLIQPVFELKSMVINGEYSEHPPKPVDISANYAWDFVLFSPMESLYTFTLSDQVLLEFRHSVELMKHKYIDKPFHSLEILKAMMSSGYED